MERRYRALPFLEFTSGLLLLSGLAAQVWEQDRNFFPVNFTDHLISKMPELGQISFEAGILVLGFLFMLRGGNELRKRIGE